VTTRLQHHRGQSPLEQQAIDNLPHVRQALLQEDIDRCKHFSWRSPDAQMARCSRTPRRARKAARLRCRGVSHRDEHSFSTRTITGSSARRDSAGRRRSPERHLSGIEHIEDPATLVQQTRLLRTLRLHARPGTRSHHLRIGAVQRSRGAGHTADNTAGLTQSR